MRRVRRSALQSGFRLASAVRGRGVPGGAAVASSVGGSGAPTVGRRLVVSLLAVVGAAVLVAPGSAWATTGHAYAGEFGGYGGGDGQFGSPLGNGPAGVAVMPSTGEVFTVDYGQGVSSATARVQRFTAAGVFQAAFPLDPSYEGGPTAIAADAGGFGAVYVATGVVGAGGVPSVVKYSAAGVKAYALDVGSSGVSINAGAQVAVDPVDGTVYATATTNESLAPVVASFDQATGAFIALIDGASSPEAGFSCLPSSLAVDGSQRVYVLDPCKNRVDRFSAAGLYEAWLDPQLPPRLDGSPETLSAVAADPASDEVYVSHTGPVGLQVTHLSAGGATPIYTFDASDVGGVRAMAVSGVGTVYTSDASRPFVERFTRFEGPTVVTGDASSVEARSAVLEGTIDPESVDSSYHFEYGTDQKYGSRTEGEVSAGDGSGPVVASVAATGLKPNTTYHFRIVGSNASGSIDGPDKTFTTGPAPATVDGVPPFASAITPRTARIHGSVNTNNAFRSFSVTYWWFEYGKTTAYGSTAPDPDTAAIFTLGSDDLPVASQLEGLEPGTLYHFRVVADNQFGGRQFGMDQTFITAPAAGGGATDVTVKRATLTGTINPHGEATTYHFNYGPTSSYGASTPEVDAGAGDGDQQVTQPVTGLSPDTIYYVQVVATSAEGVKRFGANGLFRTAPAPTAMAISPIGVSTGSATLVGEVDTHGRPGTYRFDVSSLDSSYRSSTTERAVAGDDGTQRVSVPIDGLPAGETFVVRMRVTSNDSVAVSDQIIFATAPAPRLFPAPPSGGASSYGCTAPRLASYDGKPKPGDTIAVSGQDLGAGGTVVLGERSLVPAAWSTGGFKLEVPDDAAGTLALTVNCGQRSNTIAIAVFKRPSSRFSIANKTVRGSKATLAIKVAGPGTLTSSATKAKPSKVVVRKARAAKLVVKLNRAGIRALRKARTGRLEVPIRVRYVPAGGRSATKTVTVTFKRTAGR